MNTESYSDFIDRCAEGCNCEGTLFSSSDAKTLLKKLAKKLDTDANGLSLYLVNDDESDSDHYAAYLAVNGVKTNTRVSGTEIWNRFITANMIVTYFQDWSNPEWHIVRNIENGNVSNGYYELYYTGSSGSWFAKVDV